MKLLPYLPLMILLFVPGTVPVSYTHLDVYKRQAQECYEKHKVLTYPRTDSRYLPEDYLGRFLYLDYIIHKVKCIIYWHYTQN